MVTANLTDVNDAFLSISNLQVAPAQVGQPMTVGFLVTMTALVTLANASDTWGGVVVDPTTQQVLLTFMPQASPPLYLYSESTEQELTTAGELPASAPSRVEVYVGPQTLFANAQVGSPFFATSGMLNTSASVAGAGGTGSGGGGGSGSGGGSGGGSVSNQQTPAMSTTEKIALGAGAVVVVGGILWAATAR